MYKCLHLLIVSLDFIIYLSISQGMLIIKDSQNTILNKTYVSSQIFINKAHKQLKRSIKGVCFSSVVAKFQPFLGSIDNTGATYSEHTHGKLMPCTAIACLLALILSHRLYFNPILTFHYSLFKFSLLLHRYISTSNFTCTYN